MINYITAPFKWFFKLEAASGVVLLIAAIIALILSNTNLSNYCFDILNIHFLIGSENFGLDLSVLHWINDVLMSIFFFSNSFFSLIETPSIQSSVSTSSLVKFQ